MPESVQIGILTLGAVLILIALLGGNFKLFGAEVSATISNRLLRFVAFALGTALLIVAIRLPAIDIGSAPTPTSSPQPITSPVETVTPPTATPTNTPTPSGQPITPTSTSPPVTPSPDSACMLTINNELVALMAEPDAFSQEVARVQPGNYTPLDYVTQDFVGRSQGWFLIEADGRRGWVRNDTWTINRKSAQCP